MCCATQRRDRLKRRDLAGQGNAADIRVPYSAGGDAALGAASAGRQLIAALLQSPKKIPMCASVFEHGRRGPALNAGGPAGYFPLCGRAAAGEHHQPAADAGR